jgi:hypothetical protein
MQNNDTILNIDAAQGQHSLQHPQEVRIIDFNMPFWSMVKFMVKLSLASIPAYIILVIIFAVIFLIFGGIFVGLSHRFHV